MPVKSIQSAARTRSSKPVKPVSGISVDGLADRLISGLVISDVKGKQKVSDISEEQIRLDAMRSVNLASQSLSKIVQSGWKNTGTQSSATSNARKAATTAAKHLATLRQSGSGVLEVERVAMSVLGKLVGLELYEDALDAVQASYRSICALHNVLPSTSRTLRQFHLFSIPLPGSSNSIDLQLLTVTSMYLAYALITLTNLCFGSAQNQKDGLEELNSLSRALMGDTPTLSAWLPHCSTLPSKQLDPVLTRTYTILTRSCASLKSNHEAAFVMRMYAMECLAYSSVGTVEANTFWAQVVKFAAAFIRSKSVAEEKAIQMALDAFTALMAHIEKRNDQGDFLRGKGFVEFCEHWLIFARRNGDIDLVNRVAGLIQGIPSASSSSITSEPCQEKEASEPAIGSQDPSRKVETHESEQDVLEAARICATLAQVTSTIEQKGLDTAKHILQAATLLKDSQGLLSLLQSKQDGDANVAGLSHVSNKVDRAIERLRRAAINSLDAPSESGADTNNLLRLLQEISHIQLRQCYFPHADANIHTRALDTLFVVARTELVISDPRTYVPAHDTLRKAAELIESHIDQPSLDIPNYLRCISGAFHNLAGTLYQASRHGSAIGFLKHACTLGSRALTMRKERQSTIVEGSTRTEEGWKQLEEQLCRRWELLGVAFMKIGDRRPALDAFQQYILTFPYSISELPQMVTQMSFSALFDSSNSTKQLANIVDRITYISACELLMEPSAVPLNLSHAVGPDITGVLLERQIESLEPSRWKEGVSATIAQLFTEVLKIYTSDMPIRRARVLVKCMEFMYYTEAKVMAAMGCPEDLGNEVEELLLSEHFGKDASLAGFRIQYRASAHLLLALHAHRRSDAEQSTLVARHLEEACKILKTALRGVPELKSPKKSPPKQTRTSKMTVPSSPTRKRSTRKIGAVARSTVNSKPKRKALQDVSLNAQTPPQQRESERIVFDDFDKFFALLQLATRISGVLALGLSKVHLLDVSRKLCDQHVGVQSDGYIISSIDLACEYVELGRTRRAALIFEQGFNAVGSGKVSDEASALFYLRFSESLAMVEDIDRSCSVYSEALALSERFDIEDKSLSTIQRVRTRVKRLEKAAIASHVFALIQYTREDVASAIDGMLRSLRLWNRAMDAMTRMRPTPVTLAQASATVDDNPFNMSGLKNALPTHAADEYPKGVSQQKVLPQRTSMDGMEWRISEGLLNTLFSLNQLYFNRGSVREAEYFAQQAQDLAESLNAPVVVSRALVRRGEVHLYQGKFEASLECLTKAATLLEDRLGVESIDVRRLRGAHKQRMMHYTDAHELYEESLNMIEELNKSCNELDDVVFRRKSHGSLSDGGDTSEVVLPELFAMVLRQRIWLLRERDVQDYAGFLDKLITLPHSIRSKAEENGLMAKLSLNTVYNHFRADMFLSSLTESTISLPLGMSSKAEIVQFASQDIIAALDAAKKLFWEYLIVISQRGNVVDVRDAIVSLALVQAFQTSLGLSSDGPHLAVSLLASSVAITLRRELLEAIPQKFPREEDDDIQWPLIGPDGCPHIRPKARRRQHHSFGSSSQSDEDIEPETLETSLKDFWASIQTRYQSQVLDDTNPSTQLTGLPASWTVVHMSITEDKSTLFVTRQYFGTASRTPLVFCIPLKGRRDGGGTDDDEQHMTFDDAIRELKDIVRLSDEGTKAAVRIKADDRDARVAWWKERSQLDTRLRELLENVEFCWLGAFKTILNPQSNLTPELVLDLRSQFEKVFHQSLRGQSNKSKQRTKLHKKSSSSQSHALPPNQVTFDDALLESFSTLSPKCRDEEMEDLIYFVLDLYQFHGVPVATAEIDITQVAVDLRAVLEDHAQKLSRQKIQGVKDEHLFLVLDKNLQGLPWESIPILRGRSVSRIPSVEFLHDRVLFAQWKRQTLGVNEDDFRGAVVDPRKGYYILNPSGDLDKTEGRFRDWARDMEKAGWEGIVGRAPSEQQFLNALRDNDLVVYFGHGGGEQYIRSHKIRNLSKCAATMLWGCSSGALREMGDFDRIGTANNYMLAGCPCIVANLWDVTDRDIDKFSQSVFDKLCLTATGVKQWGRHEQISVVDAVGQSRDSCKLKYLTGAAPVVYGIPFYI